MNSGSATYIYVVKIKQTFAYQLQNLEIVGSKLCLVRFLKRKFEVDLARDMLFLGIPSLQFVPSLNSLVLLEHVRVDLDEAQKGFVFATVVDINGDFGMFPKNITVRLY